MAAACTSGVRCGRASKTAASAARFFSVARIANARGSGRELSTYSISAVRRLAMIGKGHARLRTEGPKALRRIRGASLSALSLLELMHNAEISDSAWAVARGAGLGRNDILTPREDAHLRVVVAEDPAVLPHVGHRRRAVMAHITG